MTETASSESVLTERRDAVLLITLNRPDARNAIDGSLARGLAAAVDELDGDADLGAGVITGAGRGFCSGMDLKGFVEGESPWIEGRGFAGIVEAPPVKPLVAAIEGFAVAGGLEVALACDLLVAARGARLGLPEVRRGLVATGGGLRRLPERIPYGIALEVALTGEFLLAERAYELGLLNRLVEPGETVEAALALASAVAVNAPLSIAATKRVMREQASLSETDFWPRQAELTKAAMESDDAIEGSRAFAEKRDPVWRGR